MAILRIIAFGISVSLLLAVAGFFGLRWADRAYPPPLDQAYVVSTEVLDADGYDAFREAGDPFDPAVARRLHEFIYSTGNSVEPAAAFRAFRGRGPKVGPMLAQRGLVRQGG